MSVSILELAMHVFRTALLSAVVSVMFVTAAQADIITNEGFFSVTNSNANAGLDLPISVPTFNTSVGTLTSITFALSGQLFGSYYTSNVSKAGNHPIDGTLDAGLYGGAAEVFETLPTQSVYVPQGNNYESEDWIGVGFTLQATGAQVDSYEDNSSASFLQVFPNSGLLNGNFPFSYEDNYEGYYTETFNYTPVPEPYSVALFAIGLAALFGARAWQSKQGSSLLA